ncbi:hypothetical protein DB346_10655 [Verrucomicrobia bacterium LW23]|nr:hypothetical protein DB346_10655 [Verrucomicrobia bacterium LW23]
MSPKTIVILTCVFCFFVMGILWYVANEFDKVLAERRDRPVPAYVARNTKLPYPASRRETNFDVYFGTRVSDPYRWLEDGDSKEVKEWTAAQDKFTREYLAKLPERAPLLKRFKEIVYTPRVFPPVKYGKRYFYMKRDPAKEKELYCYRDGLDGDEVILIDPNDATLFPPAAGESLGGVSPSYDGKLVAFGKNPNNADESTLYVMDVATRKVSEVDKIEGAKYATPSWTPDGAGFYYVYLPPVPEEKIPERPALAEVRYHKLGTPQKDDVLMHEKVGDASMFIDASLSRDGRWLLCTITPSWSSNKVYVLDLQAQGVGTGLATSGDANASRPSSPTKSPAEGDWKPLAVGAPADPAGYDAARGQEAIYSVTPWRGHFYIFTNEKAPRYKLVRTPTDKPGRENWEEIIPERADSTLRSVHFAGDKLVTVHLKDVLPVVEVVDLEGYAVIYPGRKPLTWGDPGMPAAPPEPPPPPPEPDPAAAPHPPSDPSMAPPEGAAPGDPNAPPAAPGDPSTAPAPAPAPMMHADAMPSEPPAPAPAAESTNPPAPAPAPVAGPPAPAQPASADTPPAAPGEAPSFSPPTTVTVDGQPAAPPEPPRLRGLGLQIAMPGMGAVSEISGEPEEDEFLLTFSSPVQPLTIYRGSASNGTLTEWQRNVCPADLSPYMVEQIWYNSSSARIPMFVIRRKDLVPNGQTPFLLTAYGGFGDSYLPEFNAAWIPWLEAGGGCAIANIRGGGEFGEDWHKAAMRMQKRRSFEDFKAAAQHLDRLSYTRYARLAIEGSSNGGLLVGAVITMSPNSFQAAICGVPLLDMLRYPKFGSGRTWVTEYGSPDNEQEFRTLHLYSPYHQVGTGRTYPFVMFDSSANDDRVDPMHARKMAAAMQHFATPARHILLRVEGSAGHGGADALAARVVSLADNYAFLMKHVGLTPVGMEKPAEGKPKAKAKASPAAK